MYADDTDIPLSITTEEAARKLTDVTEKDQQLLTDECIKNCYLRNILKTYTD